MTDQDFAEQAASDDALDKLRELWDNGDGMEDGNTSPSIREFVPGSGWSWVSRSEAMVRLGASS